MVSSPTAPLAASEKGRRLVSTSCGSCEETMMSIVPSFSASTMALRSSSARKGGESLKKVRYSPISFSFSVRWLIEMPQVALTPRCRARRIASADSGTEILAA
ncbi:hypothetical protein D3C87_1692580 [compost metagenome]